MYAQCKMVISVVYITDIVLVLLSDLWIFFYPWASEVKVKNMKCI